MIFRIAGIVFFLFCVGLIVPPHSRADEPVEGFRSDSGMPLPRFVSLRSDKVYVRAGPALRYPIRWIYKRTGMPVEIIQEFEGWRKVNGFDGEEGWIHESLLSGERMVLVRTPDTDPEGLVPMREGSNKDSRMIARIEPMVVAGVEKCEDEWCRIKTDGYRGWVERNFLWGIYPDEDLN